MNPEIVLAIFVFAILSLIVAVPVGLSVFGNSVLIWYGLTAIGSAVVIVLAAFMLKARSGGG